MLKFKPPQPIVHLTVTLALTLASLGGMTAQAQALNHGTSTQINPIIFAAPLNPPSQGAPTGRRQGGASRGPCQDYGDLTALMPVTQDKVWGITASDRPTFWFYLPTHTTPGTTVEFVLQESDDEYIYQRAFELPNAPSGVIGIPMPASAPSLEIDKTYYWTFSVSCDAAQPSSAVFVRGSIYRTAISADLQRQVDISSPLERVSLYAAHGIWQEALTVLANLRRSNPDSPVLVEAWRELLQQVELGNIVPSPLISCCSPEASVSNNALRL